MEMAAVIVVNNLWSAESCPPPWETHEWATEAVGLPTFLLKIPGPADLILLALITHVIGSRAVGCSEGHMRTGRIIASPMKCLPMPTDLLASARDRVVPMCGDPWTRRGGIGVPAIMILVCLTLDR